uniref:Uncharacterized protein n=1 Tax=viral metagenome TaxID=1070528 RepID=A0A6C0JHC2_9ZZZZ
MTEKHKKLKTFFTKLDKVKITTNKMSSPLSTSLPRFLSGVTGYYHRMHDSDTTLLAIRPISYQEAVLYACNQDGEVLPFPKDVKIDGVLVNDKNFTPDSNGFVTLQLSTAYSITQDIFYMTESDYRLCEYFVMPPSPEEKLNLYTMLVKGTANKDDTTIRVSGSMAGIEVGRKVSSDLFDMDSSIIDVNYDENTITVDSPVTYSGNNITIFI